MKKLTKLLLAIFITTLLSAPAKIHAASDNPTDTTTDKTQTVFSSEHLDGNLKVENTTEGKMYIQDFKEIVEVPLTRGISSEKIYKVFAGREILTEEEFIERKNAPKTRATLSDSYSDGRGTHLYAEIVYSQQTVRGSNAAKYISVYCNSSGSTLSSYSVTYGQRGVNQNTGKAYSKYVTENINLTLKTFSRNVEDTYDWPPMYFGPGNDLLMSATQNYNCRGYTNSWMLTI